ITNIPSDDLQRFMPGFTHKMVWASTRKMTRVEDNTQVLIGLFDQSVILAYDQESGHSLMETILHRYHG
ncbi:hypothetical protein EDB19DRAFT_1641398, partial [Suillus lakei]